MTTDQTNSKVNAGRGKTTPADIQHAEAPNTQQPNMEAMQKLVAARAKIQETFGKLVFVLMKVPRYQHLAISDLERLIVDPLIRDRVSIAHPTPKTGLPAQDMLGFVIWASVSDAVDTKIREQIKSGVFPIRLQPDDWASGDKNWMLDVLAPTPQLTSFVLANFKQVVKEAQINIHPVVAAHMDEESRKKLASVSSGQEATATPQ